MSDSPKAGFWSGETLKVRLPSLIDPFDADRVDCAAYTLSIGPEIYVSPSEQSVDPAAVTVRKLAPDEAFTIPPGQFAFLLTEEVVGVPADAIALISVRAKVKFRGLINVSGFHVDPGYRGQLTFSVHNAGPVSIHLKRGQPIFLIWYAGLDRETALKKVDTVKRGLDTEMITSISGQLQSFASISAKIKDLEKSLRDKLHEIEKEQIRHKVVAGILLTFAIAAALAWVRQAAGSEIPGGSPELHAISPPNTKGPHVTSDPF